MKLYFLIVTALSLPLATACMAVAFPLPDDKEKIDVQEIVKQAVINFNTRESLPRDYTYVENLTADFPERKDGHSTDTFEVVEIKGHAFRRHLTHNGKKVTVQDDHMEDEAYRGKWIEVQRLILDEQIKPNQTKEKLAAAVKKIMADAGLTDWKPQLFTPPTTPSMGVVTFEQTLYQLQLPLQELDQKFHLKAKGEAIINDRKAYVVQADPMRTKDNTDDAANFRIKVWIDEKEMQIIKVEGRAVRDGSLAKANYAAFSSKVLSRKAIEERKQELADSSLLYGEGTLVMQEWTKVNDELWLLHRRHVKGSHVFVLKGVNLFAGRNYSSLAEYDTISSNYRKFRVEHHILPPGPVQQH